MKIKKKIFEYLHLGSWNRSCIWCCRINSFVFGGKTCGCKGWASQMGKVEFFERYGKWFEIQNCHRCRKSYFLTLFPFFFFFFSKSIWPKMWLYLYLRPPFLFFWNNLANQTNCMASQRRLFGFSFTRCDKHENVVRSSNVNEKISATFPEVKKGQNPKRSIPSKIASTFHRNPNSHQNFRFKKNQISQKTHTRCQLGFIDGHSSRRYLFF